MAEVLAVVAGAAAAGAPAGRRFQASIRIVGTPGWSAADALCAAPRNAGSQAATARCGALKQAAGERLQSIRGATAALTAAGCDAGEAAGLPLPACMSAVVGAAGGRVAARVWPCPSAGSVRVSTCASISARGMPVSPVAVGSRRAASPPCAVPVPMADAGFPGKDRAGRTWASASGCKAEQLCAVCGGGAAAVIGTMRSRIVAATAASPSATM